MIQRKSTGSITKNFKYSELNHSGYAATHGIRNIATGVEAQNQVWLAIVLQIIRDEFNVPMTVTSGYRSSLVNQKVGGSKTSAHVTGSAADVVFSDIASGSASQRKRALQIGEFLDEVGIVYDQLIYYKSWIHIGMNFTKVGRRQIFAGK